MPTSVLTRTAAQLFMVGVPGPALDDQTRRFLAAYPPGGIILFKRNVASAAQLRRLTAELHATGAGVAPLVALDHEGGRVHRLPRPFTRFPPAATLAAHRSTARVEAVGRAMGTELRAVGIDLDFAPVLDVWTNPRNTVIGDRAYGTEPGAVARLGLALARGLLAAGVLPCGKHFPGHGGTSGDSHFVLPRAPASRRVHAATDLVPFVSAVRARLPALMTAHVVHPALDPQHPATLSRRILDGLLRRRLGFTGALFSDDLEMGAVAGHRRADRAAVAALDAGCDMLLVCQSLATARLAIDGVAAAIGRGRIPAARVATALARTQALRRWLASRPSRRAGRLAWPAHARLAARLAAPPRAG
jgi:beta-N-acetylhexosaminidase